MIFIEKTITPPESLAKEKLKKSGLYNCKDVHSLLCKDFFDKCYICGIAPIQDGGEIEHLIAHKGDVEKNLIGIIFFYLVVIVIVQKIQKNLVKILLIVPMLILVIVLDKNLKIKKLL